MENSISNLNDLFKKAYASKMKTFINGVWVEAPSNNIHCFYHTFTYQNQTFAKGSPVYTKTLSKVRFMNLTTDEYIERSDYEELAKQVAFNETILEILDS